MDKLRDLIPGVKEAVEDSSIRALKEKKNQLLKNYHKAVAEINKQIEALRYVRYDRHKKRGTKLKKPDWRGYHEPGRDREPTPSGGMGGGY